MSYLINWRDKEHLDELTEVVKKAAPKLAETFPTLNVEYSPYLWGLYVNAKVQSKFGGWYTPFRFYLYEQMECCGMVVLCDVYLIADHQRKGLGHEIVVAAEALTLRCGYTLISGTLIVPEMAAQAHILTKAGWEKQYEFRNNRTRNVVEYYKKQLQFPEPWPDEDEDYECDCDMCRGN